MRQEERDGGDVAAGAARLQQPLLLLPLAAGEVTAARQALQEDHLGDLSAARGMANPCLLAFQFSSHGSVVLHDGCVAFKCVGVC